MQSIVRPSRFVRMFMLPTWCRVARLPFYAAFLPALVALGLMTIASSARADFDDTEKHDYFLHKRQLCYEISTKVQADSPWPAWIDAAFSNWQQVASQTGWGFRKCAEGEKPDIIILFADKTTDPNDTAGGGFVGEQYELKLVPNVEGRKPDDKTISGGHNGWETTGATTLDPVRVVMHEITHAMRMRHGKSGWNTGNFEEPISPGNHTGTTPSAKDTTEAHKGAVADKPATQITIKLPACFDDEAARKAMEDLLKGNLSSLEEQQADLNSKLHPRARSGENAGEYSVYTQQFFDALNKDPDVPKAYWHRLEEVVANIERINDLLRDVKTVPICPKTSMGPPPPPPTGIGQTGYACVPGSSFGQQGNLVLSGVVGGGLTAEVQNVSVSGALGDSTTTVTVQPAADYFVVDNVSVGAFVPFEYSTTNNGGPSTTLIGVGARGGYDYAFSDRFSIWPRAGVSFESTSTSVTVGGKSDSTSQTALALSASVPVLLHLAPAFFVGLGPTISADVTGDSKVTSYGVSFLLGGVIPLGGNVAATPGAQPCPPRSASGR